MDKLGYISELFDAHEILVDEHVQDDLTPELVIVGAEHVKAE